MSNNLHKDEASLPYADMISVLSRTLASANHMIATLLSKEGIDDLMPSHGDILMQLFSHEELPMAALADAIGKDPSTVTALVKKLADTGYVKTEKSASDRRINNVSLTTKGHNLKDGVLNINKKLLDAMGANLSASQLINTRQVLLTMKENFKKGLN